MLEEPYGSASYAGSCVLGLIFEAQLDILQLDCSGIVPDVGSGMCFHVRQCADQFFVSQEWLGRPCQSLLRG